MTNIESIPQGLATRSIWLAYRLVDTGKGRVSKPPVSPTTGRVCAKTDVTEQVTLTEALVGVERYDLDGVGVVLPEGMVCIDLDSCFTEDGTLTPIAQDVYDHFNTFAEYSPSGNGLHIYMFGTKPNSRTKDAASGIEVYATPAFLTVTGDAVEGCPADLMNQQDGLEWLFSEYLPPIVAPDTAERPIDHGSRTPSEWLTYGLSKDTKLATLYNATDHDGDESSTDFSLLSKLAYWLNRDEAAITTAFMASSWVSTKDKAHAKKLQRADYLPDSVAKAAALCSTTAQETSKNYETKAVRFFTLTPQADGEDIPLEDYTDLGNAEAMAAVFGDVLCHTPEWGWCFYNDNRWETDVSYRAMEAARDIAKGLMVAAKDWVQRVRDELDAEGIAHDGDEGKARLRGAMALLTHAMKAQSEHGITAMVALNKAYLNTPASAFNTDPWLLNTPKGVIDLKSGELMPHDPKYRLTTSTALTPERIPTPMFDAFMERILVGDADLKAFVQKALGSALVGKVYNENLIIANGTGANGKSTLFNTVQYILGDYATAINPDMLMSSKPGEAQVAMAMLQGKRFVVAQETEEGQRLSSSNLKRVVSTDKMVVKQLYKNPHEITPIHTLVLSTNYLPKVSSTDLGTWRRILVLPFTATIPPSEMVTDFHSLLIEREGAGILQWAVDGAVAFSEGGCDISERPEAVVKASSEYRVSEDWIAAFLGECCNQGDGHDESVVLRHTDLYRAYHNWAKNGGEYIRSSAAFSKALTASGCRGKLKWWDSSRGSTVKVWFGLRLIESVHKFQLTQGSGK